MAWLRMVWGGLKTFWWIIVLVLALVLFVVCFFYLVKKSGYSNKKDILKESFVKNVADKVTDAVTDVKVEKAVIKAETSMKRKELEDLRKETDGKKRREKLASILQDSL